MKHVSASQVSAFMTCPRNWYLSWVKKLKSPPTPAQQRGTYIHSALEKFVKTGEIEKTEWGHYVSAAIPFIPNAKASPSLQVEKEFFIDTKPGLPKWKGFIDLFDATGQLDEGIRIIDYKTTSDFKYAKTPHELAHDPQMISYAKWAFDMGVKDKVSVAHVYIKTAKKAPKTPKGMIVPVTITKEHCQKVWESYFPIIEQMIETAKTQSHHDLEPTGVANGQCTKYGGCYHRQRCGIGDAKALGELQSGKKSVVLDVLRDIKETEKETKMSMDWLFEEENETAHVNGHNAELSDLGIVEGVIPPDAPSRMDAPVTVKETANATAEEKPKKKRGRPKKKDLAGETKGEALQDAASVDDLFDAPTKKVSAPDTTQPHLAVSDETKTVTALPPHEFEAPTIPTVVASKPAPQPATKTGIPEFDLYIDCMPIKGGDFSLFEDWFSGIEMQMDEVAAQQGLPSYMLLKYGDHKALITMKIFENMKSIPPRLFVRSKASGATDALSVLIPYARTCVRGVF